MNITNSSKKFLLQSKSWIYPPKLPKSEIHNSKYVKMAKTIEKVEYLWPAQAYPSQSRDQLCHRKAQPNTALENPLANVTSRTRTQCTPPLSLRERGHHLVIFKAKSLTPQPSSPSTWTRPPHHDHEGHCLQTVRECDHSFANTKNNSPSIRNTLPRMQLLLRDCEKGNQKWELAVLKHGEMVWNPSEIHPRSRVSSPTIPINPKT